MSYRIEHLGSVTDWAGSVRTPIWDSQDLWSIRRGAREVPLLTFKLYVPTIFPSTMLCLLPYVYFDLIV